MAAIIRLAEAADAAQVASIYAPFVKETAVSFELQPPGEEEMRGRIIGTLARYPWLVCERDGDILGYAYATTHRARPAYQWCVETAIYTSGNPPRAGVGRALYTALLRALPIQGFQTAYAGVTLPNPASVGLHEAMGFEAVGTFRAAGYKFGEWRDVGWWQRPLQPLREPLPPLSLAAIAHGALQQCMEEGAQHLRV